MLIALPNSKLIITAIEGNGDNLSPEDTKEGYVDYWLTSLYRQGGEDIVLLDQGQLLTSKLISELSVDEQVERLLDYWEVGGEPHVLAIKD